jgi:Flp pilus assembly protein TadD
LRLLGVKVRNFWSAFQYDDLSIITSLREERIILPGLYFGVVAAFGIPGMILAWRRAPRSRWISMAIVLHMASLLTVFVTERYRLPIVPGLMIFAVFGLFVFWRGILERQHRLVIAYLVLILAAASLIAWPQRNPALWALDAYNSGWQALESGRKALEDRKPDIASLHFATAERKLQTAHAYVADNAEVNFALGELRQVQSNPAEAKHFYASTLLIDPQHRAALNNLGLLALDEKRFALAEKFFRRALAQEPRNPKTHFLLAKSLLAEGETKAAGLEIDQALSLAPNQPEFLQFRNKLDQANDARSSP